jgi:enamine deaminase RidA (YjgF/YER057c/UK114 family)
LSGISFHTIAGLPSSVSPSSHATEADGLVYLTGQFGRDLDDPARPLPEGICAQTERTLSNMRRVLASLDLSMDRVLRVRVFLTHFKRDYDAMNEVYAGFFPADARPVRTCVGVTDLVRDALIEIDCVAKR